ncbi:MAG: hypothetical protein EHM70_06445 [Chloroflexota bacterium]|nr:MAG: hypothetical protein EHM70_06445 [Chloroflexota bacterium]
MSAFIQLLSRPYQWILLKTKTRQGSLTLTAGVLFFVANLALIYPALLPDLADINPWDESVYIHSGQMIFNGEWQNFAGNPLAAIFYALTYLPFSKSPYWFVYSCALGRVILFALLWLSACLFASQVTTGKDGQKLPLPAVMAGFLLVSPFITPMLRFPSDPLFASLAGFSLWQIMLYKNTRLLKHIWLASLFLGLATLARNDGLLMFPILAAVVIILSISAKQWLRTIPAVALPFAAVVGGYILFFGLLTGRFEMGTMGRTYDNFEAGHQAIYNVSGGINPVAEAKLEARRAFGTPEENNLSVFNAIQRNPKVYLQRLLITVKQLPDQILHAYGIRFAPVLFLLAARGILALLRSRQYGLLLILFIWPTHLASGLIITLFREGHLLFHFYIMLSLAITGLVAILENIANPRERIAWGVVLVGAALYGILDAKLAIFYGVSIFLIALLAIYAIRNQVGERPEVTLAALFIFLCAGLVIHGSYPSPTSRVLGDDAKEQALVYMWENLDRGEKVAGGAPGMVWAAQMTFINMSSPDVPVHRDSQQFYDWMVSQGVRAVYVDHSLYNDSPAVWELIKAQIGTGLTRVFSGDEGDIQVLLLQPDQ